MARVAIHFFLFFASLHLSLARTGSSEKATLNVEIGREGQVLMRQGATKLRDAEVDSGDAKPHNKHRGHKEAVEAFADPHKIDDSWLGSVSMRMPPFVEKYPFFYASSFVGASVLFLIGVCFYVQYEDYKESQVRQRLRLARRQAMAAASALAGGGPHRMGAAFTPPHAVWAPTKANLGALHPAANGIEAAVAAAAAEQDVTALSDAGFSDVAISEAAPSEAAHSEAARSDSMRSDGARSDGARFRPAPRATVAEAAAAVAQQGMEGVFALSDAVGNFTGVLAGENTQMPKFNSPFASTDVTTVSGTSTPRSRLSSQQPSVGSAGAIRSGTVLAARVPEVIFASTTSWQEIGEISPGQQVVAAAPPELVDAYTMVPIKPRGAVDLKTLEVMHEY